MSRQADPGSVDVSELGAFGHWVVTDRDNETAKGMYRRPCMTTSDLRDVVFSLDPRAVADALGRVDLQPL